jgi:hypothetical protein
MKYTNCTLVCSLALSLALAIGPASRAASEIEKQRQEAEQQVRPNLEQQRKDAEEQARKSLDQEAIAAIDETGNAIKAIADNKSDEALAAIERATGKINILVARNPATALIPVSFAVEIVDAAPVDLKAIRKQAAAADFAVAARAFPAARVLLDGLTSEIRVRTFNLPLASYPAALKDAARLLDEKKNKEASTVLLTALNTLAVIDQVTPLPIALAQGAVNAAQELRDKDKDAAQKHLTVARNELERAKELGYAGKDPEYAALNKAIKELEKQLKDGRDTGSLFASLKEKISAFFARESQTKQPAQTQQAKQKQAAR